MGAQWLKKIFFPWTWTLDGIHSTNVRPHEQEGYPPIPAMRRGAMGSSRRTLLKRLSRNPQKLMVGVLIVNLLFWAGILGVFFSWVP